MKKVGIVLLLAVCSLSLTAFAGEVATPDWWKKVAEPYKGITIHGVSESTPPSRVISEIAVKDFEALTGIEVEFDVTFWDEMYTKSFNDMQAESGMYDFIYIEQDIIYTYLEKQWLTNLTTLMAENPDIVYGEFDIVDFTSFIDYFKDAKGDLYGIPFEAFLKTYVYRKDLFEDSAIRQAFQTQYGWELRPPKTWEEYEQIADFFTRWGEENNIELYGHTAQAADHACLAYEMAESIWPSWGIWNWGINMDNWRARSVNGGTLDSVRAKDALKWYIEMLRYAPPDVRTYTWDEAAESVASGKVAQALLYGENVIWIATDASRSTVTGKIGVALPPAASDVMDEIYAGKGDLGYYDGAAFGIPVSSGNKEAALLFLQFVTRKEWAPEFAARAGRVVRKSSFASERVKEMDQTVNGYYTLLKESGALFAGAPEFPVHLALNEIQRKWITQAVAGEITTEEACDNMAREIDETLDALGYSKLK